MTRRSRPKQPKAKAAARDYSVYDVQIPEQLDVAHFREYFGARDAARTDAEQLQPLINTIWCGDCRDVLRDKYPDNYFDLIVTSPPYAEARKNVYGGIPADRFAAWMLERTSEYRRVLKPTLVMRNNARIDVMEARLRL
jgi:hypothetical protein